MTTQPSLTPAAFAAKWHGVTTTEKASAQEHFIDLRKKEPLATPGVTGWSEVVLRGARRPAGPDQAEAEQEKDQAHRASDGGNAEAHLEG